MTGLLKINHYSKKYFKLGNMVSYFKKFLFKLFYKIYTWSASGKTEGISISERIVEYPFAVKKILNLPKGSSIIILGCHGDLLSVMLPELGYKVTGLDVKHFSFNHSNFNFVKQDLRHIDSIPDVSFDAVVAISTIEHVGIYDGDENEGDFKAVKEVYRILKKGGIFIITLPYAKNYKLVEMHERIYDFSRIRSLLKRFTVEDEVYYSFDGDMWIKTNPGTVHEATKRTNNLVMISAKKTN